MSPQSSGFRGLGDPRWLDNDDWPDDDWPEDNHPGGLGPRAGIPLTGVGQGSPRGSGVRPLSLFLVALVVCAVSVVVTLWLTNDLSPTASSTTGGLPSAPLQSQGAPPGSLPTAAPSPAQSPGGGNLPVPGGGGNGGTPVIGGGGDGGIEMLMVGRVEAVTSDSITIAGSSHTLTVAVTQATQISGRAHSISAIKVGDTVSAQITQSGERPVAAVIEDLASVPGGLP
jgi:hypothetical protein